MKHEHTIAIVTAPPEGKLADGRKSCLGCFFYDSLINGKRSLKCPYIPGQSCFDGEGYIWKLATKEEAQ